MMSMRMNVLEEKVAQWYEQKTGKGGTASGVNTKDVDPRWAVVRATCPVVMCIDVQVKSWDGISFVLPIYK